MAQECAGLTGDARAVLDELLADTVPPVVLHGDLHHRNLLRGPDDWVAVDPHGLVGDPGYDVGPLLLNLLSPDLTRQAARRVGLLAALLPADPARLQAWGFVRAGLSLHWSARAGTAPLPRVAALQALLRP